MKRYRRFISFGILILLPVIIFSQLINGCARSDINTLVTEEIEEIRSMPLDQMVEKPVRFDATFVIHQFSDGGVSFEVNVFHPKEPMYQVIVSAYLGEPILDGIDSQNFLVLNRSLISNVMAVKDAGGSVKEIFNLIPNGDVTGISASSSPTHFKTSTFNDVLDRLPYVVIKVSWQDERGEQKTEYIKFTREKYLIEQK